MENKNFFEINRFLKEEGYVFLKGVIPHELCSKARAKVMNYLSKTGAVGKGNPFDGKFSSSNKSAAKEGYTVQITSGMETKEKENYDTAEWREVCSSDEIKKIYDGAALKRLLHAIFSSEENSEDANRSKVVMLPDQSWLRLMRRNGATQEHADYYYFKNESAFKIFGAGIERKNSDSGEVACCYVCKQKNKEEKIYVCALCDREIHFSCLEDDLKTSLMKKHFSNEGEFHCKRCAASYFDAFTTWICLGDDCSPRNSLLGVCPKSQKLEKFDVPLFGKQVPSSFDSSVDWEIAPEMNMGDIIIFNIKTIHGASLNASDKFRLSIDTRFLVERD